MTKGKIAETHDVLVVEDEETLSYVLQKQFHRDQIAADVAGDGKQAYELVQQYSYKVILLDIMLPEMDGLAFLSLYSDLFKEAPDKRARVIALTNLSDSNTIARAMKYGATEYLVKSDSSLSEVLEKVKGYLSVADLGKV